MAAENLVSGQITNATSKPVVLNPPHKHGAYIRDAVALITKTTGGGDGSTYRFFRVRSSDRVANISIVSDALTGASAAVIGFYDTVDNGGAIVGSGNQLTTTTDISAGYASPTSLLKVSAANQEKRVWELLGLSADPKKDYDVVLTLNTAGAAGGNISLRMSYVSGN